MILHAGAGGECLSPCASTISAWRSLRIRARRVAQLLEHGDVENVQRRIGEGDAVRMRVGRELDLHFDVRRRAGFASGVVDQISSE